MQRQIGGDAVGERDVRARLVVGAVLPGEHPRHVDHVGEHDLDGLEVVQDHPVGERLGVVGEPFGEGCSGWHEECCDGHYGGEEEGGAGAGEFHGVEAWVETPSRVCEIAMEAEAVLALDTLLF